MTSRTLIAALFAATLVAAQCPAPLQSCGGSCYLSSLYCCLNGVLTQAWQCPPPPPASNCQAPLLGCSGACYSTDMYCCISGVLTQISQCPSSSGGGGSSSSGNNGGNGGNNGGGGGTISPADPNAPDLTVINSCNFNLYMEARMGDSGGPIPGQSTTVTPLPAGQQIGYFLPATGASGSRFWAKYGCDGNGQNCQVGDSQQFWPNPPGGCPPGGCQAPIDSLFEATWGCKPGTSCNSNNPTTWWDTSQVDGWTLPYKVTLQGRYDQCDCDGNGYCPMLRQVDGSQLDLRKCPSNEDVSYGGQFPTSNGFNMESVDLRYIQNGQVLGCMSPCKKLNFGQPSGYGLSESTLPTLYMCCPTPYPTNNCNIGDGCIGPQACRAGPIVNTQYVRDVHQMAPGVYAYSYDDAQGLHACPAGTVKYTMEFCPAGSVPYPVPA